MRQRSLFVDDPIVEFGNSFGHVALWTMSFFLIAVSRHTPLLEGEVQKYHIWPGRIIVICAIFHGMVHIYRWKVKMGVSLVSVIVPPLECWRGTRSAIESPSEDCVDQATGCSCYAMFRNLAGLCACCGMLVIGLTSLYKVRRRWYRVFYLVHASVAPLTMILLCLHFTRSLVYMAPSVLYYIATSFPVFAEQVKKWKSGVRIRSCRRISDECIALTIEASHEALEQYKPGQHVLVRVPSISLVSHPFTVNRVLGESCSLRIVYKETGAFTKALSGALLHDNASIPLILQLDGFHGSKHRLEDALKHNVIIIIAGGIGVVAYLSLLDGFLTKGTRIRQPEINFHWACGDAKLIQFIQSEYLDQLISRAAHLDVSLTITIHMTSNASLDQQAAMTTDTAGVHEEEPRCNREVVRGGEPFSSFSSSSRGFGNLGTLATFGMNLCFGTLISWYVCRNALKEEDSAATVWMYVCIIGIWVYVLMVGRRTDSRYFASFSVVVWSGLFLIWYLYLTQQDEFSRLLARLWSPICVVLLGVVVSVISVCSRRTDNTRTAEYKPVGQSSNRGGIELHNREIQDDVVDDCQERGDPTSAVSLSTIITECGRPCIPSMLESLEGKKGNVGIFACGPASLMQDVRLAVKALKQGSERGGRTIDIYEETFEI